MFNIYGMGAGGWATFGKAYAKHYGPTVAKYGLGAMGVAGGIGAISGGFRNNDSMIGGGFRGAFGGPLGALTGGLKGGGLGALAGTAFYGGLKKARGTALALGAIGGMAAGGTIGAGLGFIGGSIGSNRAVNPISRR